MLYIGQPPTPLANIKNMQLMTRYCHREELQGWETENMMSFLFRTLETLPEWSFIKWPRSYECQNSSLVRHCSGIFLTKNIIHK